MISSLGSVHGADEVAGAGDETIWTVMEAGDAGIPESLKKEIEGKVAVHDFVHTFGLGLSEEQREEKRKEFPPAYHPIIRTHPETGRPCLYVNPIFTHRVDGLDPEEVSAVGTPEPGGIAVSDLCAAVTRLTENPRVVGCEIVEFNPTLSGALRTADIIEELLISVQGRRP